MKLVVEEPESAALRRLLESDPDQLSSAIVEVEVVRAVRRGAPQLVEAARRVAARIAVVEITEPIRALAAELEPAVLRSLDALHLGTALAAATELDGFVTYDARLAAAAEGAGLTVLAPA